MITLVLESSTYNGSAALIDDDGLLGARSVAMRGREHEALMPAVAELLAEAGAGPEMLGRVVCGSGPGSFTSLRISGSIAKGIAMAAGVGLVPVSSLALLVASRAPQHAGRFLAAVDAMRGEQYIQLFESESDGAVLPIEAMKLVPASDVDRIAEELGAIAIGPGRHGVALVVPIASAASRITKLIDATAAADLAAWEPAYGRLAEAQVKWEAAHGRPLQPQ
ncbi:MAG: tRNA (adenosine(37)-N6)-threonylcarbamoyltransferase complex dimerization subunit type 1 TsaB [Gemmatimonadaceae bacterium]